MGNPAAVPFRVKGELAASTNPYMVQEPSPAELVAACSDAVGVPDGHVGHVTAAPVDRDGESGNLGQKPVREHARAHCSFCARCRDAAWVVTLGLP